MTIMQHASGMPPSAARQQLEALVGLYLKVLPRWSFPAVPFAVAALFQVFAWFGGRFLGPLSLGPRVLVLWLFAGGEYLFMSPAMNAAQEVFGISENALIVMYHVATFIVFLLVSLLVFRNELTWRHALAFLLLGASVAVLYL